ncbi:ethanolamine utilization protein EutN [Tardiphaga alba]|uniref:Ethanolamine utilization protein EutN n=1 Tax=Tardiphaga alba TaxID=340268 RepID=A0ABX8A7C3_9BRAD|nr:ABC transporter substrate-binding protein [Tardiphaga alba]QUS38320.1 ethanolamine utilization protein EutN [Tardiphaga alba]
MTSVLPVFSRRLLLAAGAASLSLALSLPAMAQETIKMGLVAAMSGQSAKSGEAIVRGLSLAIDEINAKGGVLGKKVELVVRDDESNPAKGVIAARELVQREKVAVTFGGLDTPVSMAIVPFANQAKVPFIGVWAAGTPITRNGAPENYVFRVSAVDELVDIALVDYAVKKHGSKKPGMILINNPWGESNEKGLKAALDAKGMQAAGVEKFEGGDVDLVPQLTRLKDAGADTLFMVANVAPSAQVVKSLDRMGWKVPVVSHWGPAGGRFTELAGPSAEKVAFIQTFSFSGNSSPKSTAVFDALKKKYPEIKSAADVTPAVGIANAYDAMHLTALAIAKAGSTEGPKVREGFYQIDGYDGLIKKYAKPFSKENQDALSPSDYLFTYFKGDEILPLTN